MREVRWEMGLAREWLHSAACAEPLTLQGAPGRRVGGPCGRWHSAGHGRVGAAGRRRRPRHRGRGVDEGASATAGVHLGDVAEGRRRRQGGERMEFPAALLLLAARASAASTRGRGRRGEATTRLRCGRWRGLCYRRWLGRGTEAAGCGWAGPACGWGRGPSAAGRGGAWPARRRRGACGWPGPGGRGGRGRRGPRGGRGRGPSATGAGGCGARAGRL